ncbi:HpcH/HpaI aldolase/citrate lyase family protein [Aminobacter ciceronei]|uniref:Citrate lyase subunit beta/citryl-CoA lyase n=1 Tax=Aminobacter ciceronei TaxID=150723 RepID=A0ABR6CF78_9HYPH|nr:CoA ester lyase [Aminobacter ciceronei]MBA8909931.1 citrate lyase subunit beta/citryl-CoA lyase [Aminobacter ciceronei]MBA9023703.1 citrate lyase subunit beta/citryl-CoA lyase [Aminobacter ciceronei]
MTSNLNFVAPIFVPGHRPELFGKAAASGADAIIIDLEDAVPADAKETARSNLRADFTTLPVLVRINAAGTVWHWDDVAAAVDKPLSGLVVPKAELGRTLEKICAYPFARTFGVVALIETARGLADARQIAALSGIGRLAFGSVDFCADVGCSHTRDSLLLARSELVLASCLAGKLAPIDGVTTSIADIAMVIDDARYASNLGFGGKLCIHPNQIEPVKNAFHPDAAEIAWAHKVIASGEGATAVDGAMVDEPVRIRARSILARSHA